MPDSDDDDIEDGGMMMMMIISAKRLKAENRVREHPRLSVSIPNPVIIYFYPQSNSSEKTGDVGLIMPIMLAAFVQAQPHLQG